MVSIFLGYIRVCTDNFPAKRPNAIPSGSPKPGVTFRDLAFISKMPNTIIKMLKYKP